MSDSNFSPEFGSPYQVLIDHCESAEIKFRAEPDVKGLFFSMRGEMAIYDVALLITHEDEVFQIYITIPIATTDDKFRPLVAEFVTRANHRIVIGHFDYDIDELNAPQLSLLLRLLTQLDGRDGYTLERACREAFARVVMQHGGPNEFDLDHGLFWCAWQFLPIDQ